MNPNRIEKGPRERQLHMDPQENYLTSSIPQVPRNIPVRAFRYGSTVNSFRGKAGELRLYAKCMKMLIETRNIQ